MKHSLSVKKKLSLCLAGLVVVTTACSGGSERKKTEDKLATISAEFVNPSKTYRSAPLWVWNSEVTKADVDRMLEELKGAGFGGAFVHPRPGLITEYLSDDWFDMYSYSVEKGKQLGLDIWIYDENSYPSGFAGGHVPAEMPESYNQGQGLALTKVNRLPEDVARYYLCLQKVDDGFRDITPQIKEFAGKDGDYYLYSKTYFGKSDWHGGFSYVDLLYPGVTEKFQEITMSGYEKRLKNEFGKTIKGIFTDEPEIASPGGIRWTPDLFDVFEKQWGYDLKTVLPSLVEETGNWKQIRHNYIGTLLQLFIDRWSKPWFNYCNANGLNWTGHYWEHGWPEMGLGGDNMAMYAWHQMPAVDMLFNQFNETSPQAQFGNVRAIKELRSVANQMGYKRTLSETYGGGGWEVTFKDLKRLADWEYVLGVNFMNQHLVHMTLSGARKYDYPPVFTYHSPWFSHYKMLNDYHARLSLVLSKGEQYNDLLILEPTTTIWSYYSYAGSNPQLMQIGTNFQAFVTKLEKSQVEYDLGSENIIKDQGSVGKGVFRIGKRSYKKVIIPPMTENLDEATFKLLQDFVKGGGQLIAFSTPTRVNGKENEEMVQFMADNTSNIKKISDLTDAVISQEFVEDEMRFENVNGGNLYHQRRAYKDGEVLFLVNSSMEEAVTGSFSIKGKQLLQMDAMTGQITTYPGQSSGENVTAQFSIPPAGSLLLFSSESSEKGYKTNEVIKTSTVLKSVDNTKVKRIRENALTIDFCDIELADKKHTDLHVSSASDLTYKQHGFPNGNPWNTSVQYKRNIVDRDTFKTGGVNVIYKFTLNGKFDKSAMKLVTERPAMWSVKVNGQSVTAIPGAWWLDKSFGVFAIDNIVKEGENTVELSVKPMRIHAEIEPVYIIGDFAVEPAPKGWVIKSPVEDLKIGSWKQQGQPFYSWEMGYSKNYQIDDLAAQYVVKMTNWTGTVAEVLVNNKLAGTIAFEPWGLNISSCLQKGDNQIEVRVIGSLKNLLGPHHKNPGAGFVSPWQWKGIAGPTSGKDYQQLDYGLMDDFTVESSK